MEEFFEMMEHHHSILDFRINVKVFRPSTFEVNATGISFP